MRGYDRRAFLAAGAAAVTALSGCTQVPGTGGGPESGTGTGGSEDAPTELETLDVGGSSGETVPVVSEGTVTLLDFFATYCAPCKPQMDELRTVRSSLPDVHMLSITWETEPETVRSFWREYDGTWPVAMEPDMETGPAFGVDGLPTMLVLDAEGVETWRHRARPGSEIAKADRIEAELEAARQ
ncbi:TlpA family protein disulfide reductase [Halorientalis halophila]|uniref:TlpA family protein disulfide reductase n=1 Tax=Halorientalis halophila TaxID=3108499 RepID=UPI00300B6AD5